MKVSELFQKLSFGELSNLSIGTDGSGDILATKKPKILHYANKALLRLFTRYLLKESNLLISQIANLTMYRLHSKHSVHNLTPAPGDYLYIQDTPADRFQDDLIKVTAVFDQNGVELPLNDIEDPLSAFTPQNTMLQIVNPVEGAPLGISYQARHVPLTMTDPDQEIEIPDILDEALTLLIAHYVFSDMSGAENLAKSQEMLLKYEALYAEVEGLDLVSKSISTTNTRFRRNGWV